MLANAVQFVNLNHGGNAVFHARLDRDEVGRHGVDVFFAPRYVKPTKRRNDEWISLTKFGKALAMERFGQKNLGPKTKSLMSGTTLLTSMVTRRRYLAIVLTIRAKRFKMCFTNT